MIRLGLRDDSPPPPDLVISGLTFPRLDLTSRFQDTEALQGRGKAPHQTLGGRPSCVAFVRHV